MIQNLQLVTIQITRYLIQQQYTWLQPKKLKSS